MDIKVYKLINECVEALERINHQNGFNTISKQTLNTIMARFIEQNASPDKPGNQVIFKQTQVPKPPVIDKPQNIINIFGDRSKSIQQINRDNEERIRQERDKNNRKVLGIKGRRKQ